MYETISFKIKYPGLQKTLNYLYDQSLISVEYCAQKFGQNLSIDEIWTIGKQNLIYQNDAKGIEQIQSVGTLFENNIHGIPGAGDCDCFTVFSIAMLLANGYELEKIKIVLQGNERQAPSHIFTMYENKFIDFTEPFFNVCRNYNFYQILHLK